MADTSTQDVVASTEHSSPPEAELSKASSKPISSRASPAAGSREQTAALETSRTSRRESLNVTTSVSKAIASTTGSENTSARNSPQPDAAASSYGTRSRHRGANRINYAEDKESEMDFEYTAPKGSQNSDSKTKSAQKRDTSENGTSKSSNDGVNGKNATTNSFTPVSKEPAVLAPNNTPVESKKRKAPGSGTTSASSDTHGTTRKASNYHTSTNLGGKDSNMVSFEKSGRRLKDGCLVADDGQKYKLNDFVYLVCEPPGEPYYIARIMEFLHANNDSKAPIDAMRINWIYRPRDIHRKEQDSRGVFASMHSDPCPITSIRGKCTVKHRSEINDLDEFKKLKDCFYFSQMYDRYIQRYYDVIPTKAVINVPENVKKVLDERWQFIIVELGKGKEFTSAVKTCKRCSGYCANDNSVDCAVCKNTYHMNCVQPPLQKKPARGFAWSCGPCSRKQERRLEARNTPIVDGDEDEEFFEEDDGDAMNTGSTSPAAGDSNEIFTATKDQIAHAQMWPYRYLGIHCKPTDALDYDDRIYPRASSRLGPRHQAPTPDWPGRPFEFVKPTESKKKYGKNATSKKDSKFSKETLAAMEADRKEREKRPKWVVDQPPGYLARGKDPDNADSQRTSTLIFKLPEVGDVSSRGEDDTVISKPGQVESDMDAYMVKAKGIATKLGLSEHHTNFLDRAVSLYCSSNYNASEALVQLEKTSLRKDLKEPNLNKEELKRFEEAVAKYGSHLGDVTRTVKTQKYGDIVRFYYVWKKTEKGKAIWGSREDRKSKKHVKVAEGTFLDDVADDADDSAFDNEKAAKKKRGFLCKFCSTKESRFWRRAPLVTPGQTVPADGNTRNKDKGNQLMLALCGRCASLWRKYALRYDGMEEVAKRLAVSGGRTARRKADEELFRELVDACEVGHVYMGPNIVTAAQIMGLELPAALTIPIEDPARKKQKVGDGKQDSTTTPDQAKKKVEKPPAPEPPPLVPEEPKVRDLPCSVCFQVDIKGQQRFSCRNCKLTVHRSCYGIPQETQVQKWTCDCCSNDASSQVSTDYVCTLCPVEQNQLELFELPRSSHKKKTERDREKERLEKELFNEVVTNYQKSQEELGRPIFPREALKTTAGSRWMHAVCAIWTQGIKFWDAKLLDKPEGVLDISIERFGETCKICKSTKGVCTHCPKCSMAFHPSCAQIAGHTLGFFVTPVKGSRKDVVSTAHFGNENGHVEAVIYCSQHDKAGLHLMHEVFEDGTTALQTFLQNFKQADPSYTGTMRKAAAVANSVKSALTVRDTNVNHRNSITNGTSAHKSITTTDTSRFSPTVVTIKTEEIDETGDRIVHLDTRTIEVGPGKICRSCHIDVSPKWHKQPGSELQVNGYGHNGTANGSESFCYCHKCYIRQRDLPTKAPPQVVDHPAAPVAHSNTPIAPVPVSQPQTGWVSTQTAAPVTLPQPGSWQSPAHTQPAPRQLQPSLMNGTSQSPPPQQGLPPQLSPYSTPSNTQGYTNGRDRRDIPASASPRAYSNNRAGPYYTERRPSESVQAMPPSHPNSYSTIHQRTPSYGTSTLPAGPRSPPSYRVNSAPIGPPRPSDNPFYAPPPSQSPRQSYLGPPLQGSHPRVDDRPLQPRPYDSRPSSSRDPTHDRKESERPPVVNGASASPSLKNLLH